MRQFDSPRKSSWHSTANDQSGTKLIVSEFLARRTFGSAAKYVKTLRMSPSISTVDLPQMAAVSGGWRRSVAVAREAKILAAIGISAPRLRAPEWTRTTAHGLGNQCSIP